MKSIKTKNSLLAQLNRASRSYREGCGFDSYVERQQDFNGPMLDSTGRIPRGPMHAEELGLR